MKFKSYRSFYKIIRTNETNETEEVRLIDSESIKVLFFLILQVDKLNSPVYMPRDVIGEGIQQTNDPHQSLPAESFRDPHFG